MAGLTPSGYATQPPTSVSYIVGSSSTTSTISSSLTSTRISSTLTTSIPVATVTSTHSSSLSATASTASVSGFAQLAGSSGTAKGPYILSPASLTAANFQQICPQGNCYQDCQNLPRVFESLPDGINTNTSYGKAPTDGSFPNPTLFGVCTNLDYMSELTHSTSLASYFPNNPTALEHVNVDITMCLLDTCQKTRDPSVCLDQCSLDTIRPGNASVSAGSIVNCMKQLCVSTCGLPYANQDVFGVGILASYIVQAVLVFVLAAAFIVSASWHFFRKHKNERPEIPESLEESMKTFLNAQCYFGISAVVASYFMHPSFVDPLNGYALLSVSITGFLPTTFTLMLLHNHGIKSWYTTLLTLASWLMSSVLFFILVKHLTRSVDDPRMLDQGLKSLFNVPTCGGSSAMSLCRQMFDTDPMSYLSLAYNSWTVPNIKNIPVLWVLSTIVLWCLIGLQVYDTVTDTKKDIKNDSRGRKWNAVVRLGSLYLGSILFVLALASQARMAFAYAKMGVIDWDGWTFGQVVALLFWIPPLLDCIRSYTKEWRKKKTPSEYSELNKLDSSYPPTPLPVQTPSPPVHQQGFEPLRSGQRGEAFRLTAVSRKPVVSARAASP